MEQYIKLIKRTLEVNDYGQQIASESVNKVIADSKSVTRAEFYQAISKFTPSLILEIRGYEYSGEAEVETEDGKRYEVIRTYQTDFEDIELTCQLKTL